MRGYDVRLELKSGDSVTGRARDTRVSRDKIEYLVLNCGADESEVALHEITRMNVETPNASFNAVQFSADLEAD